jgi:hypothetical protein
MSRYRIPGERFGLNRSLIGAKEKTAKRREGLLFPNEPRGNGVYAGKYSETKHNPKVCFFTVTSATSSTSLYSKGMRGWQKR